MAIRVTQSMMSRGFLINLNEGMRRMDKLQEKLYTGKAINRLSDDPLNLQTLLRVDTTQNETEQYMENLNYMMGVHAATEQALNNVIDVVSHVRTLMIKALNDTNTFDERSVIAAEIASLMEHLLDVGNTEYSGTFVFAGTDINHRPLHPIIYDIDIPGYEISDEANREARIMEIGNDVILKFNLNIFDVFGDDVDDPNGEANTLAVFRRIVESLQNDDWEAMNDAFIEISDEFFRINHLRSEYGTLDARFRASHTRHFNNLTTLTDLRNRVEDTDMAGAIMYLKTQETVYRTALETGARLLPPSLVDYLR